MGTDCPTCAALLQRLAAIEAKLDRVLSPTRQLPVLCSRQQADVVRAFDRLTRKEGRPPTLREVGADILLTESAVGNHVQRLRKLGLMAKPGSRARGWVVTEKAAPLLGAPDAQGVA